MKNPEEKIFIIYHYISGDGGSLVETYKPESIGDVEIFVKTIIKDEDIALDYIIVGKDFTEFCYSELKDKTFQYITFSGEILTV